MKNLYPKIGNRRNHHKFMVEGKRNVKEYKKFVVANGGTFKRNWRKILKSQINNK